MLFCSGFYSVRTVTMEYGRQRMCGYVIHAGPPFRLYDDDVDFVQIESDG